MKKHPELPKPFADLGIEVRFLKALHKMQFVEPSDIQKVMIPPALEGRDILGQAQTGTGKTAAFGLPILQGIEPAGRLQALCLAPTRELAIQITGETRRLAQFTDLRIVTIYGGQKVATQLHQLGHRPHYVVGTPGRVMDFMRRGNLDMSQVRFVVLDEVDRMLDIGFRDDIKYILGQVPKQRQTMFVSATLSVEIKRLATTFMGDPLEVNVSSDDLTVDTVEQWYVTAEHRDKFDALRLLIKQENPKIAIVFCNTKAKARKVTQKLHRLGINAKEIHGDLAQRKRDQVMDWFRKHKIQVLVATDLAARGIDVSAITHIINYDIPLDAEAYVHRIGRTARMGASGVAIALVTTAEGKQITAVEKLINKQIPHRTIAGFTPSDPPPEEVEEPRPVPVSRLKASVFGELNAPPPGSPPKTLGSKFRPARKRRRL